MVVTIEPNNSAMSARNRRELKFLDPFILITSLRMLAMLVIMPELPRTVHGADLN